MWFNQMTPRGHFHHKLFHNVVQIDINCCLPAELNWHIKCSSYNHRSKVKSLVKLLESSATMPRYTNLNSLVWVWTTDIFNWIVRSRTKNQKLKPQFLFQRSSILGSSQTKENKQTNNNKKINPVFLLKEAIKIPWGKDTYIHLHTHTIMSRRAEVLMVFTKTGNSFHTCQTGIN